MDGTEQDQVKFFESYKASKAANVPTIHDNVENSPVDSVNTSIQQWLSCLEQKQIVLN